MAVTDWTTIGVGLVTASAALAGSIASPLVQARLERKDRQEAAEAADRDRRRKVYADLLGQLTVINAAVDGALHGPKGARPDVTKAEVTALHETQTMAELLAPPAAWARMEPYVEIVQIRANANSRPLPASRAAHMQERVAELLAGRDVDELRDEYLAAAREDVADAPPPPDL